MRTLAAVALALATLPGAAALAYPMPTAPVPAWTPPAKARELLRPATPPVLERARLRPEASVDWNRPLDDRGRPMADDLELMRELGRRAAQSLPADYYGIW